MLELALRKHGAGGNGAANATLILAGGISGSRRLRDIWTLTVPANPVNIAFAGNPNPSAWKRLGTSLPTSLWSMASCVTAATPSWKVVIFGGMTLDTSGREECSNTTLVWDVEQQQCSQPADGGEDTRPDPRAEPALTYNERTQRLCLIGGWNLAAIAELFDPYLSSIHQLDIASVRTHVFFFVISSFELCP